MVDYLEETPVLASRGYFRDELMGGAREGDGEIYGWNLFVNGVEGFELGAVLDGLNEGRIHGQSLSHGGIECWS